MRDRRAASKSDSYEPATVNGAWDEYCEVNPECSNDASAFEIFRAGWRRGFGQGALLSASTFVHAREDN